MSDSAPESEEPPADEPVDEPADEEPAAEEPADEEPADEEPADEEPADEEPAVEEKEEVEAEVLDTTPWIDAGSRRDVMFSTVYTAGEMLGRPNDFGHTMKGTHKETGEESAVKLISKAKMAQMNKQEDREHAKEHLISQIKVMTSLDPHANVVQLRDVFESNEHIYLVMELASGGDLNDHLAEQDGKRYDETFAVNIIRQVARGIRYLHLNKIAHCDIQPANLVFTSDPQVCEVKICDFGMAQFAKGRRKHLSEGSGSVHYMAPEVINGDFGMKCDMWSMGVLSFMLLYGYHPFLGKDSAKIQKKIKKGFKPRMFFTKTSPGSAEARDFIISLLNVDPIKRPTILEAFESSWLDEEFDSSGAPQLDGVVASLKKLQNKSAFRNEVLGIMSKNNMSKEELATLKQTFKDADANGDGVLSVAELSDALRKSTNFTEEEMKSIVEMADLDGDGQLSYDELLKSTVQKKLSADEERVYQAFQKFDTDGDGMISVSEMKQVLGISEEEVKKMIAEVDTDSSGEISYDEFIGMWAKESGGYAWDDDVQELKADEAHQKEEVENRRTSMLGAAAVAKNNALVAEMEANGVVEEEKGEELPSVEDILAGIQNPEEEDLGEEGNAWLDIATGGGDDDEEEKKPKKEKKSKSKKDSSKKDSSKKDKKSKGKKDTGKKAKGKKDTGKKAKGKKDSSKKDSSKKDKKSKGKKDTGKKSKSKKKKKKKEESDDDDGDWADILGL